MFTGIIQHKGIVSAVHERSAVRRIIIASPIFSRVQEGDSVAIDGICSTVVDRKADFITVEYMQETVRRTTVGEWKMGKEVNIELSLRANSYMGGSFRSRACGWGRNSFPCFLRARYPSESPRSGYNSAMVHSKGINRR